MRWLFLVLLIGCGSTAEVVEVAPVAPVTLDGTECAVCGMTVAEQASPRGQVVHRNGEHRHFCSLGDLVVYLDTPGPLGAPTGVWVEAMPAGLHPLDHDTAEQPWITPEEGVYAVVGDRRVMGTPVLSYAKDAARGGASLTWAEVRARLKR